MDVIFQQPLIIALIVGTVWKAGALARAPHDRVLRILVVCLVLLTAGELLSLPALSAPIDRSTTAGVGKVLYNGIYMSGLYALILVFHFAMRRPKAAYRRQLRFNTSLLAGIILALVIAVIATPAALRGQSLTTSHMAKPAIASFYIIGNAYFFYAYLTAGLLTLRYTRIAQRHLALGLRIMMLGLLGLTITSVNRLVFVFLRIYVPGSHQALNTVNWSMTDWSEGIVLVGISYSGFVQLVKRSQSALHHRRMYHQLGPLWTILSGAYPELLLKRPPTSSRWDFLRLHRIHQRFYRRLIECRDGLVRLSPYLVSVAPDADLASAPADQLAVHVIAALALKPAAEGPNTELFAARIALPANNDLAADARELIALSHVLGERIS